MVATPVVRAAGDSRLAGVAVGSRSVAAEGRIGWGSGLAEQDVGGVLGVGVLADRGDLAVADGEDADVAVVVRGTAPGGGTGGPLGDDLVARGQNAGDFQRHR